MSTNESKVILVTGAGSGMGKLTVRALMAKGHHVYAGIRAIARRNASRAAELREHARQTGLSGHAVDLHVLDERSVAGAIDTVLTKTGRIDVLIHNAAHLYVRITEALS